MAAGTGIWQNDDNGVWDPYSPQKRLRDDLRRLLGDDLAKQTLQVVAAHVYVTASEHLLSPPWKAWADGLGKVARGMPGSGNDQTSRSKAGNGSDDASQHITHG